MQDSNATADSLDIVYEELKQRMATQNSQIDVLDGKANFGLASSSLLTAVVVLNEALSVAQQAGTARPFSILWFEVADPVSASNRLTTIALIVYLGVTIFAFLCISTSALPGRPPLTMASPRVAVRHCITRVSALSPLCAHRRIVHSARLTHTALSQS